MRTFIKYLESITDAMPDDSFLNILRKFSHKEKVAFALYCVKDVAHLNTDPRINNCIHVIEQWLEGKKVNWWSPSRQAFGAYDSIVTQNVAYAVGGATQAIGENNVTLITYAINAAALAKSHEEKVYDLDKIRNEYRTIARNWLRKWQNPDEELKQVGSSGDPQIMDILQDKQQMHHLIKKVEDNYILDFPGMNISGKTENEVIEKTLKSPKAMKMIQRLFRDET